MRTMVYFDYASLVPPAPEALDAMRAVAETSWGHPASLHLFGARAEHALEQARIQVAEYVEAMNPKELVFTPNGRDALALAMRCALARLSPGARIASSRQEHVGLQRAVEDAEKAGFEVVWLEMPEGVPSESDRATLAEASLVALGAYNHELGTSLLDVLEGLPASTVRVVDAVQLAPWQALRTLADDRTYYALSGAKLGVPPSLGVARVPPMEAYRALDEGRPLEGDSPPWLLAVGLGAACAARQPHREAHLATARARAGALLDALHAHCPDLRVNGAAAARLGPIVSLSFPGYYGKSLTAALSLEGILVSHTAACQARREDLSPVVRAAYPHEHARAVSTVRFSVSERVTLDEIARAADGFSRMARDLRPPGAGAYTPKGFA